MYAEILLNQKYSQIQESCTYEVPSSTKKGSLVIAPYKNKKLGGVVLGLSEKKPSFRTREIIEVNGIYPEMPSWQVKAAEFIADRYLCSRYKAYKLFLPNKILDLKGKNEIPEHGETKVEPPHLKLTSAQTSALASLTNEKLNKFLVHGITGSGKTEIYLQLAYKLAQKNKQTLILVPEISLTPQLTNYFKKVFHDNLAVIHSQLTQLQRTKEWLKIMSGKAKVIIGPRSVLFSPFKNLGAIIIDEEHDLSYKQEQVPRYHTHVVAEKIAELTNAKLIFASATPAIETYHRKDIELIHLPDRIGETPLPEVDIVDMREELKARNFSIFSDALEASLTRTLAKGKQAILFLNRRGTASSVTCRECGFTPECQDCSVRMTYHTSRFNAASYLLCHHCNRKEDSPSKCPTCGSIYIKNIGIGTERVEQEICTTFPQAKVLRADRDTVKTRHDFPEIYKRFHEGSANVLIGTQMIGKGLDIDNVDLVAVILADIGLHVPDFRSQEFIFQTLTQVSGRAGRRKDRGKVIIQTYNPDNFAIQCVKEHDYENFYKSEIETREKHNLPPFYKIIKLTYTDPGFDKAKRKIEEAARILEEKNLEITHAPALIARKHGKHHYNLFIKGKNFEDAIAKIKKLLTEDENWKVDIDPLITI